MKKLCLTMGVILSVLVLSGVCLSADEEAEVETEYAYGHVVSISSTKIVVKEYDYDNEQDIQVTYIINSETTFVNIDSYSDIKSGDDVEINFKIVGDQKIVVAISKEIQSNVEEEYEYEGEWNQEYQEDYQEREYLDDSEDGTRG